MWTRELLKTNAKNVLYGHYWHALAVSVVAILLCGGIDCTYSFSRGAQYSGYQNSSAGFHPYLWVGGIFVLLLSALILAYSIFVEGPVTAGQCRYFMERRVGNPPFTSLFSIFGRPDYLNVAKVMFMQGLFIFLWSLLLIVPGIVKAYQYRMVPYLMAENPNLTWREALELSRKMTDNEKGKIFVLDLSFIGWYLLGALAFGIGMIFVVPYFQATNAELYAAMRAKALANNWVSEEVLSDFVRY